MPTLVRLLTTLTVIAAIIYGIMAALVYFVEPTRRETTIEVPLPQLQRAPEPAPADGEGAEAAPMPAQGARR